MTRHVPFEICTLAQARFHRMGMRFAVPGLGIGPAQIGGPTHVKVQFSYTRFIFSESGKPSAAEMIFETNAKVGVRPLNQSGVLAADLSNSPSRVWETHQA
jgi:hypothetical protein